MIKTDSVDILTMSVVTIHIVKMALYILSIGVKISYGIL